MDIHKIECTFTIGDTYCNVLVSLDPVAFRQEYLWETVSTVSMIRMLKIILNLKTKKCIIVINNNRMTS